MAEFITFSKEFGLFAAFTATFIFWTWQREMRLYTRVTELEKFVESTLMQALGNSNLVVERCTSAMKDCSTGLLNLTEATEAMQHALTHLEEKLNFRPCVLPEDHPAKEIAKKAAEDYYKQHK